MKKFFKPTKFKISACLIGGLVFPISAFISQQLEPEGYVEGPIWAVAFLVSFIASLIPGFIIHAGQSLLDPASLVSNNEADEGFYLLVYLIFVPVFNFIFSYILAAWIEWRKSKNKPSLKIPAQIILGVLGGILLGTIGMITLAGIGGGDCDVPGRSCNCFCCHMFGSRGYESCGLLGILGGISLGAIIGVFIPSVTRRINRKDFLNRS